MPHRSARPSILTLQNTDLRYSVRQWPFVPRQAGSSDLTNKAFERAGNAFEALIRNADPEAADRGFRRTIAATAYHLAGFSAVAYSLFNEALGDLNLTPGEMAVMRLVSQWGKAATPPANMPTDLSIENRTPPLTQVNAMDGIPMLTRLADLLTRYPPHANDYPILLRLRALGLEQGKRFCHVAARRTRSVGSRELSGCFDRGPPCAHRRSAKHTLRLG